MFICVSLSKVESILPWNLLWLAQASSSSKLIIGLFCRSVEKQKATLIKRRKDYCFIHYFERQCLSIIRMLLFYFVWSILTYLDFKEAKLFLGPHSNAGNHITCRCIYRKPPKVRPKPAPNISSPENGPPIIS